MPTLNIEGTNLHYEVKGEGTPIIFIHPPLLTSTNFNYQLQRLSEKFQVITFDIRGHGRSDFSKQPITYPLVVNDMTRLLDYLGIEKAYVCGYSAGGSIALEFLLSNANRALGGIVISGMSEARDFILKQRIKAAITLSNVKTLRLLLRSVSASNADTDNMFRKLHSEAMKGDARNIRQYYRFILHYNCTDQLQKIDLPVLLVYGAKNKTFHPYARILHEKLPYKELAFLENEKHQIPTKAALKLNRLIEDFIQRKQT